MPLAGLLALNISPAPRLLASPVIVPTLSYTARGGYTLPLAKLTPLLTRLAGAVGNIVCANGHIIARITARHAACQTKECATVS